VAQTYGIKDGQLIVSPFPLIGPSAGAKFPVPAGGLYSTADDLARFCQMMLNKGELAGVRVVSPAAVAAMISVHTGELKCGFVDGMGFGLGFGVVREPKGVTETSASAVSATAGRSALNTGWTRPLAGFRFC